MPTAQITHNTQHINIGLSRLLLQFQGKPRFSALLAAILNEGQAVEDMFYGLLVRALDNPNVSGVTLDAIGRIVGQQRNGSSDAAYIRFLQARILTNFSNGTVETLIAIALLLLGSSTPLLLREYRKAVEIEADNVQVNAFIVWSQFLNLAKDAGTSMRFVFSNTTSTSTFKMTSAYGGSLTTVLSQRMDDTYTPGGGGLLAGVFG